MYIQILAVISAVALVLSLISYFIFDKMIAKAHKRYVYDYPKFWKAITQTGYYHFFALPSGLIVIVLYSIGKKPDYPVLYYDSLFIFVAVSLAGIISNTLKFVFGRYRPSYWLDYNLYGFKPFKFNYKQLSFPSGHATTSIAGFMSLGVVLDSLVPQDTQNMVYAGYFLFGFPTFIGVVAGYSRVALTKHYLSDVLTGMTIGIWCVVATYLYIVHI